MTGLFAQWLANGRKALIQPGSGVSVTELLAAYWRHAQTHYRLKDGTSGTQLSIVSQVIRDVRRLYGSVPVDEFGPQALTALRQLWIDGRHRADGDDNPRPLARSTVNALVSQTLSEGSAKSLFRRP